MSQEVFHGGSRDSLRVNEMARLVVGHSSGIAASWRRNADLVEELTDIANRKAQGGRLPWRLLEGGTTARAGDEGRLYYGWG